ncbi:unnamed protein product [Soboliphyme baturini]|uniref:COesterase domain-containing protein n=1 Tax=Soboliphyme baturini TaxID=241478 RepID=A0A183J382_9BILA|nr:unnamed protein product [Soboliphyme baturini]
MNATHYGPCCAQQYELYKDKNLVELARIRRSEDCLYLNVFAPPQYYNESFPVIVWIHGGGFQTGSSADYKQESILRNFVSRHVVFVTFNYRLGPLAQHPHVWWQPGERNVDGPWQRGSFSVDTCLVAASRSPGMIRTTAINATWLLQEHLGCRASNSSQLLECLKTRHRNDLLDPKAPRVHYDNYNEWVPVVDGYGGVIPESPEILASYRSTVPILLGTAYHESALNFGTQNIFAI